MIKAHVQSILLILLLKLSCGVLRRRKKRTRTMAIPHSGKLMSGKSQR